ncbi:MAG: VTT domain-containing protein [Patescibacteria group bacterium]
MFELFSSANLIELIKVIGYFGIFVIIFAESGLFFGFFLPGDSLLFTVGLLASQGFLDIYLSIFLIFIAAVIGDSVGYAFGKRVGPKIFYKDDSFFFNKNNLIKAKDFYEKHGTKTIIIARFIPVIRTLAPIVAGVGEMKYKKFISYNIIGGFIWSFGVTLAGYYLGILVSGADKYLFPIILIIISTSFIPAIWEYFKSKTS